MTIIENIENLLRKSDGFVSIHQLHKCTKNQRLIRDVATRLGYKEVFKPRSKKLLGVADYRYSHAWGGSDNYGGFNEIF